MIISFAVNMRRERLMALVLAILLIPVLVVPYYLGLTKDVRDYATQIVAGIAVATILAIFALLYKSLHLVEPPPTPGRARPKARVIPCDRKGHENGCTCSVSSDGVALMNLTVWWLDRKGVRHTYRVKAGEKTGRLGEGVLVDAVTAGTVE